MTEIKWKLVSWAQLAMPWLSPCLVYTTLGCWGSGQGRKGRVAVSWVQSSNLGILVQKWVTMGRMNLAFKKTQSTPRGLVPPVSRAAVPSRAFL